MTEGKWYPVKGFEGEYEMQADGSAVRTTPRRVRYGGSSIGVIQSYGVRVSEDGCYYLRNPKNGKLVKVRKERLEAVTEGAE